MTEPDAMPLFRRYMGSEAPVSARSLELNRCGVRRACELNELWHSSLPHICWTNVVRNKDYQCYVFQFRGMDYAVAIWSSPVSANRLTEGSTAFELRRLAISDAAPRNSASRMIGEMRKDIRKRFPHITVLVSYQDTDAHAGTIYKASGWNAAANNAAKSWTHRLRKRNREQSLSPKVRWEYRLRNCEGS